MFYDQNDFFGYDKLFDIKVDGFKNAEFKTEFTPRDNRTIDVQFSFDRNVINADVAFEIVQTEVLKNINGILNFYIIFIYIHNIKLIFYLFIFKI